MALTIPPHNRRPRFAAERISSWGQSRGPARADFLASTAASSRSRSHPAQYSGDLPVVPPQALGLLLQIPGQRLGLPELWLQVLDRFFEPLYLLHLRDRFDSAVKAFVNYCSDSFINQDQQVKLSSCISSTTKSGTPQLFARQSPA